MKTFKSLIFFTFIIALASCSSNDDVVVTPASVTFNFTHTWQDLEVNADEFNILQYVTENGDSLFIDRLRYLVTDFVFTHESGPSIEVDGYALVDVETEENLTFSTQDTILPGTYSITFRFGFNPDDNVDNAYPDLNVAVFNVPDVIGDGYHNMQMEGQFVNSDGDRQGFAYHSIPGYDVTGVNEFEDTSFEVSLGTVVIGENTTINVNMDVYEWFSNPNTWDLNVLNNGLMMNYDAQVAMSQNGASVFSLGTVTQ